MTDLSDYIFVWLIGYSALLGPIAGIMLCDYFIVRRTRLSVEALYDPDGEYAGVSGAAIAALVLAVLPNLPGFINAATGTAGTDEAGSLPSLTRSMATRGLWGFPLPWCCTGCSSNFLPPETTIDDNVAQDAAM